MGLNLSGSRLAVREYRELHTMEEMLAANALLDGIWHSGMNSHFDPTLLVALAHAGNYVVGAFEDREIVAVCVGFFAAPRGSILHSHIAGVRADHSGRGLGTELKNHQRHWCRERGIESITWTFDPLVARNAYFNISRLGAVGAQYLVDFYGQMKDSVNAGQPSDRMLAAWTVDPSPAAQVSAAGLPVVLAVGEQQEPISRGSEALRVSLQIPPDIGHLRTENPALAREWRLALREALGGRMADGWKVAGFDRAGYYVLEKDA